MKNKIQIALVLLGLIVTSFPAFIYLFSRNKVATDPSYPTNPSYPTSSNSAIPLLTIEYIKENYIQPGDLFFQNKEFIDAYYYYQKAKESLIKLQENYESKTTSESINASKDQLIDFVLVVDNRLLLTEIAINSPETVLK